MGFKHRKVGKGFSERDQWTLGEIETEEDRAAAEAHIKHVEDTKGTLRERAKRAATELNGGELPPRGTKKIDDPAIEPEEWYAREISDAADNMLDWLQMLNWRLGTELTEEDAQTLFYAGYNLGRLTKEAELKFKWEPHSFRGMKTQESASLGGHMRSGKFKETTFQILELYDSGKLTQGQIAQKLKMTKGAVKAAIRRHRK